MSPHLVSPYLGRRQRPLQHLATYTVGAVLYQLAMLLPGRVWMFESSPLWWAVPLIGYYAHHAGPWWRAQEA